MIGRVRMFGAAFSRRRGRDGKSGKTRREETEVSSWSFRVLVSFGRHSIAGLRGGA